MPDVFITLEEAATFEGIKYNTLVQRMNNIGRKHKPKRAEVKTGR